MHTLRKPHSTPPTPLPAPLPGVHFSNELLHLIRKQLDTARSHALCAQAKAPRGCGDLSQVQLSSLMRSTSASGQKRISHAEQSILPSPKNPELRLARLFATFLELRRVYVSCNRKTTQCLMGAVYGYDTDIQRPSVREMPLQYARRWQCTNRIQECLRVKHKAET